MANQSTLNQADGIVNPYARLWMTDSVRDQMLDLMTDTTGDPSDPNHMAMVDLLCTMGDNARPVQPAQPVAVATPVQNPNIAPANSNCADATPSIIGAPQSSGPFKGYSMIGIDDDNINVISKGAKVETLTNIANPSLEEVAAADKEVEKATIAAIDAVYAKQEMDDIQLFHEAGVIAGGKGAAAFTDAAARKTAEDIADFEVFYGSDVEVDEDDILAATGYDGPDVGFEFSVDAMDGLEDDGKSIFDAVKDTAVFLTDTPSQADTSCRLPLN